MCHLFKKRDTSSVLSFGGGRVWLRQCGQRLLRDLPDALGAGGVDTGGGAAEVAAGRAAIAGAHFNGELLCGEEVLGSFGGVRE